MEDFQARFLRGGTTSGWHVEVGLLRVTLTGFLLGISVTGSHKCRSCCHQLGWIHTGSSPLNPRMLISVNPFLSSLPQVQYCNNAKLTVMLFFPGTCYKAWLNSILLSPSVSLEILQLLKSTVPGLSSVLSVCNFSFFSLFPKGFAQYCAKLSCSVLIILEGLHSSA